MHFLMKRSIVESEKFEADFCCPLNLLKIGLCFESTCEWLFVFGGSKQMYSLS